MDTAYLEFTGGFDDQGQPEPLTSVGLAVTVQRLVGKDVVDEPVPIAITPSPDPKRDQPGRIVPDTRIVATATPGVIAHLLSRGDFVLVDPPGKNSTEATADHRASRQRRAKNRTEE